MKGRRNLLASSGWQMELGCRCASPAPSFQAGRLPVEVDSSMTQILGCMAAHTTALTCAGMTGCLRPDHYTRAGPGLVPWRTTAVFEKYQHVALFKNSEWRHAKAAVLAMPDLNGGGNTAQQAEMHELIIWSTGNARSAPQQRVQHWYSMLPWGRQSRQCASRHGTEGPG